MRTNLHIHPLLTAWAAHAAPTFAWGAPGSSPPPDNSPAIANNEVAAPHPEDRPMDVGVYIAHRRTPPAWQSPPPPPAQATSLGRRVCQSFTREFLIRAAGLGVTATVFVATSQGLRAEGSDDATSLGFGGVAAAATVGLGLGLRCVWRQWTQQQAGTTAPRRSLRDLPVVHLEPPVPVANPGQIESA